MILLTLFFIFISLTEDKNTIKNLTLETKLYRITNINISTCNKTKFEIIFVDKIFGKIGFYIYNINLDYCLNRAICASQLNLQDDFTEFIKTNIEDVSQGNDYDKVLVYRKRDFIDSEDFLEQLENFREAVDYQGNQLFKAIYEINDGYEKNWKRIKKLLKIKCSNNFFKKNWKRIYKILQNDLKCSDDFFKNNQKCFEYFEECLVFIERQKFYVKD